MLTPQSSHELRQQAAAFRAKAKTHRRRIAAIGISGALDRYPDLADLCNDLSSDAAIEDRMASALCKAAHEVENAERDRRAA